MNLKFSLVIPVAPDRDAEILKSVEKLDYSRSRFEVIVIRGKNPSENRNSGSKKGEGEYIIFLDDDGVLEKDYLTNVDKFLDKFKNIDIVGGPQITPADDKIFAKISGYALASKFGAWKIANRYSQSKEILDVDETYVTSANLICKRSVLKKIHFDPSLFPGEDPKFIADAKKQGFKVAYSPEIIIYHRRRSTLKKLIKQIFNYGKVRPLKEKFSETLNMPFFFVPSLFLVYLIYLLLTILFIIIHINIIFNFLIFIPLIIYVILAIAFSIYDSVNNKDYKSFFVLPFVYLAIHLSYGSGMIYGYFKKLGRME